MSHINVNVVISRVKKETIFKNSRKDMKLKNFQIVSEQAMWLYNSFYKII